jgi:protocatechuate 3,4-dioxygenase beta subunit
LKRTVLLLAALSAGLLALFLSRSGEPAERRGDEVSRVSEAAREGARPDLPGTASTGRSPVEVPGRVEPRPEPRPVVELAPFRVRGRVLDDLEQPCGDGTVEVRGPSGQLEASARVDGRGRFEVGVEEGVWEVGVAAEGLLPGFFPPGSPSVRGVGNQPRYEAQLVEVTEAGPVAEVDLFVFRSALVWGRVLDSRRMPLEGAYVFLSYAGVDYMSGTSRGEARTDATGYFEIRQPYPGNYRLFAQAGGMFEAGSHLEVTPLPVELSLEGGGVHPVGDLIWGGGSIAITGKLVDQDGQPFEGSSVKCYPCGEPREGWRELGLRFPVTRSLSDEGGRFSLEGLQPGRYRLSLAADWNEPLETRRAATWVSPVFLDLRSESPGATVDVGERFVPEARPFLLEVTFEVDRDWLREQGLDPDRPSRAFDHELVRIGHEKSTVRLGGEERWRQEGGGSVEDFDPRSLVLRWLHDPPEHAPHVLRVELRGRRPRPDPIEFHFTPIPGGHLATAIRVPSGR